MNHKIKTDKGVLHRSLSATFHNIVCIRGLFIGQCKHSSLSSLWRGWNLTRNLSLIVVRYRCSLGTISYFMPHLSTLETSPRYLWTVFCFMVSIIFCTPSGDFGWWLLMTVPPFLVIPLFCPFTMLLIFWIGPLSFLVVSVISM